MTGIQLNETPAGPHPLDMLEQEPFDIVLMDLEMPELDGLSATVEIRARERETNSRIPVIAMTAHAVPSVRQQCLDVGMDGYVTKPVEPHELFAALDAVQRGHAIL